MKLGFLARCDAQGVTFQQFGTGPAGAVELFSAAGDEHLRCVFLGRLYYRGDLNGRLTDEHRLAPGACPAEAVLAVYRQAGADGLTWLEGDYAFILWDARQQRLFASRDPLGGFPLFWVRHGAAVVLCSTMRPLLDLLPHRTVNREYLAEFVMLPGNGVQEVYDTRCSYEDVQRVLPGSRIEVSPDGTVQTVAWWDWEARVEEPASVRHEDLVERLGRLLDQAVAQRRIGRTAAHLSGGMDSTAVALLAARQAVTAGEEPVHSLSMVFERFPILSRETPYVDCALGEPGLEAHRLTGEDFLTFSDFRSSVTADEPVLSLWHATVTRAMLEQAAGLGARTLMTGHGGDQMTLPLPYHLYELLRRGRFLAAWRESARWAQTYGSSRWRFLKPFGLLYFLPAAMRSGLACWWRRGRVGWELQRDCTIPPWILPEFARRYGLWDRAVERMRRASHRCRPLALALGIEAVELNVGDVIRWELGVSRGLLNVHPFLDPRLVCFSLGWQARVWPVPERRQKPILADALRDVLPAAIRDRQAKGHFNELFFHGLSQNRSLLESLIQNAPVEDLGLLDKGELVRSLHKAALGIGEDARGADRLSLSLAVLKWLTLQQESLRGPGPPVEPLRPGPHPLPVAMTGS